MGTKSRQLRVEQQVSAVIADAQRVVASHRRGNTGHLQERIWDQVDPLLKLAYVCQ